MTNIKTRDNFNAVDYNFVKSVRIDNVDFTIIKHFNNDQVILVKKNNGLNIAVDSNIDNMSRITFLARKINKSTLKGRRLDRSRYELMNGR